MSAEVLSAGSAERDWWLRTLLVLQSPRAVFAALHDDSDEAAHARQEPLAAVVFLAGVAGVLATSITGRLMDDAEYDRLLVAVWAIFAGGIHGIAAYFVVGAIVLLGASLAGGLGSYRRARHVLGFAAVPLALSLLVWPVRLAVHGTDAFRTAGSDSGSGGEVFDALEVGFLAWSVALLAIGIRTVHGWTWPRALAATVLPAAVPALAVARAYGIV
ncbi:MAG: Yip1 family protein [Gaiellaceae bacterium]